LNSNYMPPTFASMARYWTAGYMRLYVPVPRTIWGAVAAMAYAPTGMKPAPFHIASLLFHTVSVLFVLVLINAAVKNIAAAAIGAMVFAVHPVQVESVAWASGLKDVLAGMFSLIAIWLYIRAAGAERRGWMWQCAALIALVLAILSKANAIAVPV